VNALGLYDLDRNIRNVGRAYKQLIADWRDVLPASSVCLVVPLVPPNQSGGEQDQVQQAEAEERRREPPTEAVMPEGGP